MAYSSTTLKKEFQIDQMISIHYFEYMSDFTFQGESHDFWEFLCVDKGAVNVVSDENTYSLVKDDIIFHKPNEFHAVRANGVVAPNLVVVSFHCDSPAMKFFEDKIMQISALERNILGNLIKEANQTFCSPLNDPYCEKLIPKDKNQIPFGSEQLILIYLQQLLIQLIRSESDTPGSIQLTKSTRQQYEDEMFYKIIAYMEENIDQKLTIPQICKENLVSRSILQKLFREHTNCGIIDYFGLMKINAAKQLIRNQQMNFSQIADELGYTSIHYFSRQFKKVTGMTPSEYSASIKLLSERKE